MTETIPTVRVPWINYMQLAHCILVITKYPEVGISNFDILSGFALGPDNRVLKI
jgi:hypothetical protein